MLGKGKERGSWLEWQRDWKEEEKIEGNAGKIPGKKLRLK